MGRPSAFDSSTKVRVVLEALKESCALQELGKKFGVAPNQIPASKEQFLSRANWYSSKMTIRMPTQKFLTGSEMNCKSKLTNVE